MELRASAAPQRRMEATASSATSLYELVEQEANRMVLNGIEPTGEALLAASAVLRARAPGRADLEMALAVWFRQVGARIDALVRAYPRLTQLRVDEVRNADV